MDEPRDIRTAASARRVAGVPRCLMCRRSLFLLVAIATFLNAGKIQPAPGDEAPDPRDPLLLKLSSLPLEKGSPLRFDVDLGNGGQGAAAPSGETEDRSRTHSGGLGAPWTAEPWPRPLEPLSGHDLPSPIERARPWESDRQPEIEPLKRDRDDRPFDQPFLDDNPLDDGDALDGAEQRAWWLPSRSAETFPERVWRHERHLWSFHFYGGQNFTDDLGEILTGSIHRHASGLASVGVVRHGGAFFGLHGSDWWWPTWEIEYTFTRRFEGSSFSEHNIIPLRARWDIPLGDTASRYMEISFAVSEGLSLADRVPDVEQRDRDRSHEFQNFLAFDLILGLPFLSEFGSFATSTNLFLRIHHRSDAYGLYPEEGGSNTLTVGVSFGRRRTQRRW